MSILLISTVANTNQVFTWGLAKRNPGMMFLIISFLTFKILDGYLITLNWLLILPKKYRATGEHSNRPGHGVENMKFTVLEKVKSSDPLYGREREKLLIRKFNTFYCGINEEP